MRIDNDQEEEEAPEPEKRVVVLPEDYRLRATLSPQARTSNLSAGKELIR